ncbi:MAG: nuclear transport factor 2 family protein [Deltaproteobacteria bacterium]|nr:nuclear transport factor 2 family protein [Deltaproteobacteria bacterium]
MKCWLPPAGIALGIALALYALLSGSSDEDLIRERLEQLEAAVEVTGPGTNPVMRGAKVKGEFAEIFTKDVEIRIPELTDTTAGRAELVGLATQAPSWYAQVSVDLGSLEIDLDEVAASAHVFGQATLRGTKHDGSPHRDTRTVSLRCDKIEDKWRIASITVSPKQDGSPAP